MLQRVRVKICGLRDPEAALRIAQMGADAIGLVFAPSPRWVSPEQAREIAAALPALVTPVGVFVNSDSDAINRVCDRVGLGLVQLHGDEPPELVERLGRPCIRAFRVRDAGWIDEVTAWLAAVATPPKVAAILLDAYNPAVRGGTGQRFNWEWVAQARAAGRLGGLPPLILSGGLDADVVSDAIDLVEPWAVDASSALESAPGVKDLKKVERFLRATRQGQPLRSEFWL